MKRATKYIVGSLDKFTAHEDTDGTFQMSAVPDDDLIWGGAKVLDIEAGLLLTVKVKRGNGSLKVTELTIRAIDVDPDAAVFLSFPDHVRDMFRGARPDRLDNTIMRGIRIETIASLVADHIDAQEREPGYDSDVGSGRPIYAREATHGRPTIEDIVADHHRGLDRRAMLAKYNDQGPQVIDRLRRKARDEGRMPKAETGRGNRKIDRRSTSHPTRQEH